MRKACTNYVSSAAGATSAKVAPPTGSNYASSNAGGSSAKLGAAIELVLQGVKRKAGRLVFLVVTISPDGR